MERETTPLLDELRESTLALGAADAKIIPVGLISIEDEIIEMCKEDHCEGYRKSVNCPPHAMRPEEARGLMRHYQWAVLFKIDVPPEVLLSQDRFQAFRRIYEIASHLEALSIAAGYAHAKGFSAGSCKPVFCRGQECQTLVDGNPCRYPSLARPSMEAVGMNVFKLIRDVGWEIYPITRHSDPTSIPRGMLAGLVLVG